MIGKMILFIVLSSLLVLIFALIAMYLEEREYNNGICRRCSGKFVVFDKDSQGGVGFRCEGCGNVIWVSYPLIYKENSEEDDID